MRMRGAYTILLFLVLILLAGCGGTDYADVPVPGEIQPGPGLISGDDGVFTIYRAEKKGDDVSEEEEEE